MSGNNTRARGYSPIRSYRANEKTGRAERHAREACLVRRESAKGDCVRIKAKTGGQSLHCPPAFANS